MDPYRTRRLNQALRNSLAELLQVAVKDPRVGFVTINKVELNRDHSVARVAFTVLGDEDERTTSLAGLKKARGYLQSRLARGLQLRQAPELRFEYDDSVERGIEMDEVLDDLAARGEFLTDAERRRRLTLADLVPPADFMAGLRAARNLWVVPHHNPDPDAAGAALALVEALRASGREAVVVGYPDPPAGLPDLPGYSDVIAGEDLAALLDEDPPDALVLVDCHRIDRCGPLEDMLEGLETRWCIDHHLVSGRKAPEPGWNEPRACSTCTLIHRVIEDLGRGTNEDPPFALTLDMATNLYAGLLNDTGGFRFDNTGPLSFELAGQLAALGVDTAKVAALTLHRHRREGFDLLKKVIGTFAYHADGRVAVGHAGIAMMEETGAVPADTEGFVNMVMAVEGVEMAAFLKETEPGVWRTSLRARLGADVQAVAARHGGGGHLQASGCTLEGDIVELSAMLARELTAALDA
ncbi:MAG: 30S ribosome-binding factor RbfA [bacterium]|nr:30S ribosome-binding factor RbfA [bacterium]